MVRKKLKRFGQVNTITDPFYRAGNLSTKKLNKLARDHTLRSVGTQSLTQEV